MTILACKWPECEQPVRTRGYCGRDYMRAKRADDFKAPWLIPPKPPVNIFHSNGHGSCTYQGCDRKATERTWCHKHYEFLRGRGELPAKSCKGCGAPCPGARHYCSDDCKPRCTVEGCDAIQGGRGWCVFHYTRWKIAGNPTAPMSRERYVPGQLCAFDGCRNKARKNTLCSSHYGQLNKGVDLTPLAYKSKSYVCAFCGGPSGTQRGYRRVCSSACSVMFNKHGGPLPESYECILCGDHFPFIVGGQRRKKFNTKMCEPCRRNSAKHGYSAAQLAKRDGNQCTLCNTPVDMTLVHPDLMRGSVDHIIPTSLGGSNEPENVALAHLHCNIKKNNRVDIAA